MGTDGSNHVTIFPHMCQYCGRVWRVERYFFCRLNPRSNYSVIMVHYECEHQCNGKNSIVKLGKVKCQLVGAANN